MAINYGKGRLLRKDRSARILRLKAGLGATTAQASRFLAQAGLSSKPSEVAAVVSSGVGPWIDGQISTSRVQTFWARLEALGLNVGSSYSSQIGFNNTLRYQLMTSQEHLRNRVGLALLNFLVVSLDGPVVYFQQFQMAHYMDLLWNGAFGNYRDILNNISHSKVMSVWLTFSGSKKANGLGSQPDENYARELLQLFSIGLFELNLDGSRKTDSGGLIIPTYTLVDIQELAKIFTGYAWPAFDELLGGTTFASLIQTQLNTSSTTNFIATEHDLGTKSFLGVGIPALTGTPTDAQIRAYAATSMQTAITGIFNHANVAPFVAGHLIRNLVTSNPSPAYWGRVSAVFVNNGLGVRGDMAAVVKAVLMDVEARDDVAAAASNTFGKLIEPAHRHIRVARLLDVTSPSNTWDMAGDGAFVQRIARSPSVFNHFPFAYTPAASGLSAAGLIAPEFQTQNEVSIADYANQMHNLMMFGSPKYDGMGMYAGSDLDMSIASVVAQGSVTDMLTYVNLYLAANRIPYNDIINFAVGMNAITASYTSPIVDGRTVTLSVVQQQAFLALYYTLTSPYFLGLQ